MKASIKTINRAISRLRSAIEPIFVNRKRWRRCGRAVYVAIQKVGEQISCGAIAVNLMMAYHWMTKAAA